MTSSRVGVLNMGVLETVMMNIMRRWNETKETDGHENVGRDLRMTLLLYLIYSSTTLIWNSDQIAISGKRAFCSTG